MEYFVNPVNRGFFCNDNSIYFPYKQEIINSTLLAFIIFVMVVVIVSFSYSNCLHVAFKNAYNQKFVEFVEFEKFELVRYLFIIFRYKSSSFIPVLLSTG